MKNQFEIGKQIPNPLPPQKTASKSYVVKKTNDPNIIKNTGLVDFKCKILDNVRFVKITSYPDLGEHLPAKYYVDEVLLQ